MSYLIFGCKIDGDAEVEIVYVFAGGLWVEWRLVYYLYAGSGKLPHIRLDVEIHSIFAT